jgi:hypothetical protein
MDESISKFGIEFKTASDVRCSQDSRRYCVTKRLIDAILALFDYHEDAREKREELAATFCPDPAFESD